ncbi:MAG TPA: type I secretion system permease/ATPase, partial [Beijerinckiaceae bacterium]|nr:type I secretion system permease/ATPase [Beijerinckiaceae bacterium]
MSGMINLLYLTGSFFMLEIYDRVLPSRSVPTLIGLVVIAGVLYVFQGVLDVFRGRVMVRIGAALDEALNARVFDMLVRLPLKTRAPGDDLQAVRDLDQVRQFLSSLGPTALFDLPWMPLYVGICFIFHFWIGMTAVVGALILVGVTLITEFRTREPTRAAAETGMARNALALASRRNAEVLQAMGMGGRVGALWGSANAKFMASQQLASDVAGGLGAVSKVLRMALQSAVLGVGAYLVIEQQATAGVIIASSILTSRALAPVELAIANWRGFVAARQSWKRLVELMAAMPRREESMALPRPSATLSVEGVSAVPPGTQRFVVQDVTFGLKAGNGLGVIGPSASGKSSLARLLVGVWSPIRGKVRLDGAALEQWNPEALGRHIGYLPQDVELFAGTVAENIARFEPEPDAEAILAAAKAANVHDLILRLPDGYETQIGESGQALSAGQCQRVALARALYGDPFLIVLDEPNSNLDAEGEQALTQAILSARAR